jgi:hypothetical protein
MGDSFIHQLSCFIHLILVQYRNNLIDNIQDLSEFVSLVTYCPSADLMYNCFPLHQKKGYQSFVGIDYSCVSESIFFLIFFNGCLLLEQKLYYVLEGTPWSSS